MDPKRIMIVEDEQIVAHDIARRLERMGYEPVGPVDAGEDVMSQIELLHPDLILMDIYLSGQTDGVEAAAAVRERFALPVVYLTAYSNEETVDRAKRTAPFGFVHKPVADHELRTAIEMALYKHDWEVRLRRSEDLLAATLRNLGDAVFTTDSSGKLEYMNRMAQRLSGWSMDDARGRSVADVLIITDERTRAPLDLTCTGPAGLLKTARAIGNCVLHHRDGSKLPVEVSLNSLAGSVLSVTGLVILVRDVSERERARREIEELHRQLEFVLGETRTNIDIIDAQFNLRYVDPSWRRVYGDFAGRKCYEYFMDRTEPCSGCGIVKALQTGSTIVSEECMARENNRPIQVTTVPYRSEDGEWLVAELNIDISERKRVEAEFQVQRDLAVKLAAVTTPDEAWMLFMESVLAVSGLECAAICLKREDAADYVMAGQIGFPEKFHAMLARVRPDAPELREYGAADGRPAYFMPEHERPRALLDLIPEAAELRTLIMLPISHGGALQGICWLASSTVAGLPVKRRGVLELMVSWLGDVVARLQAQQKLRESEREHRNLFDDAPVAYHEIDMRGNLVRVNSTELEMLGYKAEEMLGRPVWEFVADRHASRTTVLAKLQSGAVPETSYERRYVRRDGATVPVLVKEYALFDEQGALLGIRSALQDITEQQKAQEERAAFELRMNELQKLESIGLLAGGIAHDFNNLLMGIQGNTELALMKLGDDSPVMSFLQDIKIACRRAAELTGQLLAYAGKGKYVVDVLDLSEVVREIVQLLQTIVGQKAELQLDLADDLPGVEGDVTQLRQVIMNLITNAVEALPDRSGKITVATESVIIGADYQPSVLCRVQSLAPGRYCRLTVSDTGCGIAESELPRLFEPFFTTKFMGRGLGLAAVLGVIRNHNGDIRVQSRPGEGTSMSILLPASGAQAEAVADTPDAQAADTATGSGTILLVDDDRSIVRVVSRFLQDCGLQVLTAMDGRDALKIIRRRSRHLRAVVLDLTLPGMNGDQVFREIQTIDPELPVLFCSGYSESEAAEHIARGAHVHFIQKPYELPELNRYLFEIMRNVEPEG